MAERVEGQVPAQRPRWRRVAYGGLCALLTVAVVPFTLASVQNGEAALRWWPSSEAMAELASKIAVHKAGDVSAVAESRALASRALRISPIDARAARALGLAEAVSGNEAAAGRAFDYALRLSRRDFAVHVWFIEQAVSRNDIDGALRHYNQAMTTSVGSRATLIPVLIKATETPEITDRLIPLLKQKPNWWGEFVHLLIGTSADTQVIYRVVRGLNLRTSDTDHPDFVPRTVERLVSAGQIDRAFELYAAQGNKGAGEAVRNGGFEHADALPPLDWHYADEPDLAGLRQARADGKGTALFLSSQASRSGVVAQQIMRLQPGGYQLSLWAGDVPALDEAERPRVILRCEGGGQRQISVVTLPSAPESGARIITRFAVPQGCGVIRILVEARASFSQTSATMPWVDDVDVRPLP